MIRFNDGPVQGVYMCKRAPLWLRGVVNPGGEKDVLDQLDDEPALNERVYVYKQGPGGVTSVHINARRGGTNISGFYPAAEYDYLPNVDGDQVRDIDSWQKWVQDQVDVPIDPETGGMASP